MTLFSKAEPLPARMVGMAEIRMDVSPDQMEANLTFDTLSVSIDRDNPRLDAAIAMLKLPIATSASGIAGYLVHVRGSATLQARTRGWLSVAVGNAVATRSWPFPNVHVPAAEPLVDDFFLSIFAEDAIADKETNPGRPDPLPLPVVVMIEIEAENDEGGVIQVAAIDIAALA